MVFDERCVNSSRNNRKFLSIPSPDQPLGHDFGKQRLGYQSFAWWKPTLLYPDQRMRILFSLILVSISSWGCLYGLSVEEQARTYRDGILLIEKNKVTDLKKLKLLISKIEQDKSESAKLASESLKVAAAAATEPSGAASALLQMNKNWVDNGKYKKLERYAQAGLAGTLLRLGDPQSAELVISKVAEKSEGYDLARFFEGMGDCHLATSSFPEALKSYEDAINTVIYQATYLNENQDAWVQAIRNKIKLCKRSLHAQGMGPGYLELKRAQELSRLQNYEDAIKEFEAAIILAAAGPGKITKAIAIIGRYKALYCTKQPDQFVKIVASAEISDIGPLWAEHLMMLGDAQLEIDVTGMQAEASYKEALTCLLSEKSRPNGWPDFRIPEQAPTEVNPPSSMKVSSGWGNEKFSAINPGVIWTPMNCSWYLDYQIGACYLKLSGAALVQRKNSVAIDYVKEIRAFDPWDRRLTLSNQPSTELRLIDEINHGELFATKDELNQISPKVFPVIIKADMLHEAERWEDAKLEYDRLSRLYPESLNQGTLAYLHLPKAMIESYLGDTSKSRATLEDLVKNFPNTISAKRAQLILVSYYSPEDRIKALEKLSRDLTGTHFGDKALLTLALNYSISGEHDKARAAFRKLRATTKSSEYSQYAESGLETEDKLEQGIITHVDSP
jgi:tetratricopeptide (TPR) repeat protein